MLWNGREKNLDEKGNNRQEILLYLCTPTELYNVKLKWYGCVLLWDSQLCSYEKSALSFGEKAQNVQWMKQGTQGDKLSSLS